MQISFFEEFPTKKNLEKLKLIKFPIKLYLAAPSLSEFLTLKKLISKKFPKKVQQVIYWPFLINKEGYWISPFTKRAALKRIFAELKDKRMPVMLNLELPTTRNSTLYLTETHNFLRNKYLINKFIKKYRGDVYLAEYFPVGKLKLFFFKLIGLHYKNAKVIKMLYHSMLPFPNHLFNEELKLGVNKFGENYLAGFGTIAKGVMGWEPILSPKRLKKDIQIYIRF